MNNSSSHQHHTSEKQRLTHSVTSDKLLSLTAVETPREKLAYSQRSSMSATNSPASHMFNSISCAGSTPALSYNLGTPPVLYNPLPFCCKTYIFGVHFTVNPNIVLKKVAY